MRLRIEHKTVYRYSELVTLLPHRLVVTPRGNATLRTLSQSLRYEPDAVTAWTMDVFGNQIATVSFTSTTQALTIVNELVVDHVAPAWPVFAIDPAAHSYPFTYALDDLVDLGTMAEPDWLTPGGQAVSAWARGFVLGPRTDTLSLLKDLNEGILDLVSYRVRGEDGTQSPATTLELRSGSCRDIAALFIEAVRHLGIGARAVSGYLIDFDAAETRLGATHAWAEAYLPGAGWITFDPTHRRVGSAHLVPAAFARFNRHVMPISGGYVGSADAFSMLDVSVTIRRISDDGQ